MSGQEQHLLPNRTARLPDDPDGYIVTLNVFHSLHCLVCQKMYEDKIKGDSPYY